MTLEELFADRTMKVKDRSAQLHGMLGENRLDQTALITFAEKADAAAKATCIEALEYATKKKPEFLTGAALDFCLRSLQDKEPRVKWESARVIANTIHLFPDRAEEAVAALMPNTSFDGKVVRWATAHGLARVITMRKSLNGELVPKVNAILKKEEENSIRKIYEAAIKKATK